MPKPKIKHTKKVGNEIFHKLVAEGETSTTTCKTRKSRDKRERKHTVGVFIGAFPCGVIVIGEELHISESIKQVYSHLSEALKNMKNFSNIRQIFYDDEIETSVQKYDVSPQISRRIGLQVTVITLNSTFLHMPPQISLGQGLKVTLVPFNFTSVSFLHVSPQITRRIIFKVTLIPGRQ